MSDNEYILSKRDEAIVELLWEYLKKDPEHKDRRRTAWGTKSKYGLARCVERIFTEHEEDIK